MPARQHVPIQPSRADVTTCHQSSSVAWQFPSGKLTLDLRLSIYNVCVGCNRGLDCNKRKFVVSKDQSLADSLLPGLPANGHHVLNCGALELTLGVDKVHNIAVCLEQVDLLNAWYRVHSQPFERTLQTLVVCRGGLVHSLLLSAAAHECLSAANKNRQHPQDWKELRLLHAFTVPSVPKDD